MLTNPKHEAFALAVAEGWSATQAYRNHVKECTTTSAMEAASRLMAEAEVAARVAELRTGIAGSLTERLGVTRDTMFQFFVSILETPIGEVDQHSNLCQEYRRTRKRGKDGEEWETEHIKMVSKMDASEKLIKMAGWYDPNTDPKPVEIRIRHFGKEDAQ